MQIVTDKNKVALYYKDIAVTYKEFILNTKKIKEFISSTITISISLFKILKASFTFSTCILEVNILTTSELPI